MNQAVLFYDSLLNAERRSRPGSAAAASPRLDEDIALANADNFLFMSDLGVLEIEDVVNMKGDRTVAL